MSITNLFLQKLNNILKFKPKSTDFIAVAGLFLIIFFIFLTNFSGNFWLSGWDNLHPELNYGANLIRAFFSSWQEYQGLGLPAGNGHVVELTREIILWLISFILPAIEIRKLYLIAMLFTGALGVYFLIRNAVLEKVETHLKIILSFIAASFYILNIATVQIFYVPYEAFAAHFAFLPWMIYSLFFFMRSPSRKTFLFFILIQLLGTWQFYIPTLFIIYALIAFIICMSLAYGKFKKSIKILSITLFTIVAVNLYWLLPFLYYAITNVVSQQQAYVNLLYTADAYAQNAKFANLQNASLFKGFLFDYVSFFQDKGFSSTIGDWKTYANSWYFQAIGYSFFTISLLGLIFVLKRRKNLGFAILFIVFFGLLANQAFPFKLVNDVFRNFSLFDQIFRNPFTKFANSAILFMIILFTLGLGEMIHYFRTKLKIKNALFIPLITLAIYFVLVNIYIAPLWKGGLIYSSLKVNIPNEYFKTFDYFKTHQNGRIANLPQISPNGWDYYLWGYQGSGFIWYGINQPILDRAFDVWNKTNENYYWEISQAIYSQNLSDFEKILNKYQISYLFIDGNLTTPSSPKTLYNDKLESMLKNSKNITSERQFGRINIYKVKLDFNVNNFIFTSNSLLDIEPKYNWNNNDQAFLDYGNYKSENVNQDIYYPFRSIFTGRGQQDLEFNIKEERGNFILTANIPANFSGSKLILPHASDNEFLQIDKNDPTKVATRTPTLLINERILEGIDFEKDNEFSLNLSSNKNSNLKIIIPKLTGYFSNDSITSSNLGSISAQSCDKFNQGTLSVDKISQPGLALELKSIHSNNCLNFRLPELSQNLAFILSIPSENISGKALFVAINNNESKRDDLVAYLPKQKKLNTSYFIISPKEEHGLGYTINIDNISINNSPTINALGEMKIYPFPYSFLTKIKFVNNQFNMESGKNAQLKVSHNFPYIYKVSGLLNSNYLILSQSFDKGWHAYAVKNNIFYSVFPFLGTEVKDHILVNNWENGWNIKDSKVRENVIVVVFLPQYFEFLGIIALIAIFSASFFIKKRLS